MNNNQNNLWLGMVKPAYNLSIWETGGKKPELHVGVKAILGNLQQKKTKEMRLLSPEMISSCVMNYVKPHDNDVTVYTFWVKFIIDWAKPPLVWVGRHSKLQ